MQLTGNNKKPDRRTGKFYLCACLWLLLCPLAAAEIHHYKIPKQTLASALTSFAQQSDLQILFPNQGVDELLAPAIDGDYTPNQVLDLLLKDTGLNYSFGGNRAVAIYTQAHSKTGTSTSEISSPIKEEARSITASTLEGAPEEVLISGIRSSVWRNLIEKHKAVATLDAMTSEEVGKFPDKNAADSLQRIPGISVDRIWGEARDINIRGTDKDINRTLMNGQNVASAYWWANDNPSRGFNYTILASELISSLKVYKSPEADIDEGSIGGTVIIYTHKPFDMDNGIFRATIEEQYTDLAKEYDPQISALTSWKNSEQTLGILLSGNWQNRSMRRDGLEAFLDNRLHNIVDDKGVQTNQVYAIWGGGSAIFQQSRERLTNNFTVQFSPSTEWEAVFNYVESSSNMTNSNQNYLFLPGGFKLAETPPATVSEPRFGGTGDGKLTLLGGTLNNPNSIGAALDAIFRNTYIDSLVYDTDIKYTQDNLLLHTQIGRTSAEGGSRHDRLYRFTGDTREWFSLSRNTIEVDYLDLNPADASSLDRLSSASRDWIRKMTDEENYAQVDAEWKFDSSLFTSVKTGIKWRDQTITNNRSLGSIDIDNENWPSVANTSLAAVSNSLTPRLHEHTASERSLTRFAWADKKLIDTVITPQLNKGLMNYTYDKEAYYQINEKIGAFYVKGNFEHRGWRGNIGIRATETRQDSQAYQENNIHLDERRYNNILPNINVAYDYSNNIVLRGSLAKVMARPTFQNLSSNIVIDGTSETASSGNPYLDTFEAKQADAGVEWYFDKAAILSTNIFYKSISTYIYTKSTLEHINGNTLNVTRPYNAEGADIAGLELQWQQDFNNGFGVLGNYTLTEATVPSPEADRKLKLPGNSHDQINASLYYENASYNLRLSYNYRSKSYGELISGTQDETNAYSQWDFSASWKLNDKASVYLEGINLTNEVIYYRTANNIPQGLYEHGRRFSLGTRINF